MDNEESDQTAQMCRLICVFVGRTFSLFEGDWIYLVHFPLLWTVETSFVTSFFCFPAYQAPSDNGSTPKSNKLIRSF